MGPTCSRFAETTSSTGRRGRGIRKRLLSPFDYFGVPDNVDYENIPWRSRRFDEEALTEAVATRRATENALEQLQKRGQERTLAFCVRNGTPTSWQTISSNRPQGGGGPCGRSERPTRALSGAA